MYYTKNKEDMKECSSIHVFFVFHTSSFVKFKLKYVLVTIYKKLIISGYLF